jgi:DNA-directed RNA polymerase specialized sigma24 family protein
MTAHPVLPADLREMHARATRYLARRFGTLPPCIREELVQDAFLSLFRRAEEETVRRPLGWVLHAVRYRAHVWWRDEGCARRAPVPLPEELADAYRDPLARLAAWQLALLLVTAPAHHHAVLEHLYLQEGEVEEYAAAEGITEQAVYQRHAKALAWLRDAAGVPRAPRQAQAQLQTSAVPRSSPTSASGPAGATPRSPEPSCRRC